MCAGTLERVAREGIGGGVTKMLVCGSRDYADKERLFAVLDSLWRPAVRAIPEMEPVSAIIEGCAHGADNLAEFIRLLCAANRQPRRGVFRSRPIIEALLGKGPARRLIDRGDLLPVGDEWVVSGWEHWQEGNLDVAERMRRIRGERAAKPRTNGAHSAHNGITDGAHLVAPTPKATRQQGVIDDEDARDGPDEIELLTDDLLAPSKASPKQLRAFRNFGRAVGVERTLEVMRRWRGRLDVADRFTGAFEELEAEAEDAKAGRGKSSKFAYLDAES